MQAKFCEGFIVFEEHLRVPSSCQSLGTAGQSSSQEVFRLIPGNCLMKKTSLMLKGSKTLLMAE